MTQATASQTTSGSRPELTQMKAIVFHEFGDHDVLQYELVDRPSPQPGHVLIKILAAGVNRLDHYIRE